MSEWQSGTDVQYGISKTTRILLVCSFLVFVLGGTLAVVGVAETVSSKAYSGIAVTVLAVGMYTLIVMFAGIRGPPTGFQLKGMEVLKKVKPAIFFPAPESQLLFTVAFFLFSGGCICVVVGFERNVPYLWILGYSLSTAGFLLNTVIVTYGPMTIKPGALVVAFPDDVLPVPGNGSVETPPAMKRRHLRKNTLLKRPRYGSRRSSYGISSMYVTETSKYSGTRPSARASRRSSTKTGCSSLRQPSLQTNDSLLKALMKSSFLPRKPSFWGKF